MAHIPVLLDETIGALDPKPNENFVDCTFGWGGHSRAILEKIKPDGKVLGIEWDSQSLAALPSEMRRNEHLTIENDSYANIAAIVKKHNFCNARGILFDFGMSSWHVDESKKGFSFSKDEPLDMRFCPDGRLTAEEIVNESPLAELERIFNDYGQERYALRIARAIEKARRKKHLETTLQLAGLIEGSVPPPQKKHCDARIFQALRIAVNHEFSNMEKGIDAGFEILDCGGRMAAISFHSLEDGIVKRKFKDLVSQGRAALVFKKPAVPGEDEIAKNPRSRSAKLRAIVKVN